MRNKISGKSRVALVAVGIALALSLAWVAADKSSASFLKNLEKALGQPQQQQQQPAQPAQQPQKAEPAQVEPPKKENRNQLIFSGITDVLSGSTEVSYEDERVIGESLSLEGIKRYGKPVANDALQKYVNLVGSAVARNSGRPGIPYNFVVVDSPLYNAFAAPGGIIFITSTLLYNMHDESELALVLAHEIGHVSKKHALQSLQRAKLISGLGKLTAAGMKGDQGRKLQETIGGLQTVLFDKGLDQNMEFEADAVALEYGYRTGYDPEGLSKVLNMLASKMAGAEHKGTWFSTHPPISERQKRIAALLAKYPDRATLAHLPDRFKTNVKVK